MDAPVFYTFQPDLGGVLGLLVTIVLPIIVGLVTKRSTSATFKSLFLLFLAYVSAFLSAWLAAANKGVDFDILVVLYNGVINFVIAIAVHFGLWKPTGATDKAQDSLNKG